ncbi:MAG: STAS domain-containing protein [Desulfobacterales bacterium]|nr:STAS domain-containing protein [Desulfobacterales bacterium]
MKTLTPETAVILGIPVDNLDLEETISRILTMAEDYELDGRPRTAVVVNTDTVTRLYAGIRSKAGANEELINILRQSDLMIPVGRPVAWAARVVGTRLKQRFSDVAFFREFFRSAEKNRKTLFLLENASRSMHRAAQIIEPTHPDLAIAGTAAPASRKTENPGPRTMLLQKITATAADFLILDLRDPASAAWYEKNRHRLYVPLTLVITGTQEFIRAAGHSHARGRVQRITGLENTKSEFRRRIWMRFFYSPVTFGFTVFPLVLYQQYQQLTYKLFGLRSPNPSINSRMSRPGQGVALKTITLPDPLDASVAEEIKTELKHIIEHSAKVVLDFSKVNFMDSSGLGLLLSLWRTAAAMDREIFMIGLRPPVYRFLRLSRTLDFFEKSMYQSIDDVIGVLSQRADSASFYYLALIRGNAAIFHMYGDLDATRILDIDIDALFETLGRRNAVFNLKGIDFIDSAGLHFFVKIQRHVARHGRSCILCGVREYVHQMFQILRLDRLFVFTDNIREAERTLRQQIR